MVKNVELDISMGQKRIFNYDYLDDVRNIVDRHYNLYFVLLGVLR